jgi:AcrR family transcriptional regulator
MGRLIDRDRKERAKKAKKVRIANILEEARRSFLKLPYVEITLDAIGRRSGVKKGIASMYFGSKEELYLKLLQEELEDWYDAIERGLEAQPARMSDRKVAGLLASSLAERKGMLRYLAQAAIVLEQNTEIMEAYRFHRWQRDRMVEVGNKLERRVAGMKDGDGLRLLHRIQLIAAGYQPYFDPRGSLAVNLIDPDFEDLRLDMEPEIEREVIQSLANRGRVGSE